MKYADGQEISAGDLILVSPGSHGIVLFDFDNLRSVEGFDWEPWAAYLKSGVLVESEKEGLIHFTVLDPDLKLLKREHRPVFVVDSTKRGAE